MNKKQEAEKKPQAKKPEGREAPVEKRKPLLRIPKEDGLPRAWQ